MHGNSTMQNRKQRQAQAMQARNNESDIKQCLPESKHAKLVNVCRTRWVERLNASDLAIELYEPAMETLDAIASNRECHWNTESTTKASTLLRACSDPQFLVARHVTCQVLGVTRGLTIKLQSRTNDLLKAYQDVGSTIDTLEMLRTKVEEKHKEWYEAAQKVADDAGIELKAPRACGRSVHQANPTVPGATAEDYFRITITTPLLDCLIQELHARFSDAQSSAASGLAAVPAVMKKTTDWKAALKRFIAEYSEDMPTASSVMSELDNWWVKWSGVDEESLPSTVQSALQQCCKHTFPYIFVTLAILAVMPITSCECERSVSALRLLKTYLRSTMGQSRLTGLALLHIHYDLAVDVTAIVDMFALKHARNMRMTNILQDAE